MEIKENLWLQLFVDAMTEKDPYKRLAMVHKLRRIPRESLSNETFEPRSVETRSKSKVRSRR